MMNAAAMSAKTRKRWMAARVIHGGYSGGKENPEHYIWRSMLIRCGTNQKNYEHVSVCRRWASYENFLSDMGPRPSPKHTLDRHPDSYGNYKPTNCRWATWEQQQQNKRNTRFYSDGKREGTVGVWAKWLGISVPLARYRWTRWGTFQRGLILTTRLNGKRWQSARAAIKPKIRGPFYKFKNQWGTLRLWSKRLGISAATLHNRYRRWKTFQKGVACLCVAQRDMKR